MSLAANAATWFTDDSSSTARRKPVNRKTLRNLKGTSLPGESQRSLLFGSKEGMTAVTRPSDPYTMKGVSRVENAQDTRSNPKVQNVMRAMNSIEQMGMGDQNESGLADFRPPPMPEIMRVPPSNSNSSESMTNRNGIRVSDANSNKYRNSPSSVETYTASPSSSKLDDANSLGMFSSYRSAYDAKRSPDSDFLKNAFGAGNKGNLYESMTNYTPGTGSPSSDKVLEKLNNIMYILEEQKNDRTNNVIPEVILYAYVGVFIIFICDTFVRIGKALR